MTPQISLVNKSTIYSDTDLPILANALQLQIVRDFAPAWNASAKVFYTPSGSNPSLSHWVLAILDDADQAGALGYHDVGPGGEPLGKVFVRTTLADHQKVSVTASHEILEMLGDPSCTIASQDANTFWALEACDMVENDEYEIEIPAGWVGAGARVAVSNFGLPSWWEGYRTVGPYDFLGRLTQPLQLSPGGYMSFLDLDHLSRGWQQVTAKTLSPADRVRARPHRGSRRSLRTIPRTERVRSEFAPGASAIPTGE